MCVLIYSISIPNILSVCLQYYSIHYMSLLFYPRVPIDYQWDPFANSS